MNGLTVDPQDPHKAAARFGARARSIIGSTATVAERRIALGILAGEADTTLTGEAWVRRAIARAAAGFLGLEPTGQPGELLADADRAIDRDSRRQVLWAEAFARWLEGDEDGFRADRLTLRLDEAHRMYRDGTP